MACLKLDWTEARARMELDLLSYVLFAWEAVGSMFMRPCVEVNGYAR